MGVSIQGDCSICGRTSSDLEEESLYCPECAKDPDMARLRKRVTVLESYALLVLVLVILVGAGYLLTHLSWRTG